MNDEQQRGKGKVEWSLDLGVINDRVTKQVGQWAKTAGINDPDAIHQSTFTEPLAGAVRARVLLDLSIGAARVHPIHTPNLIEADLTHVGEVRFDVKRDDAEAVDVHLHQHAQPADWLRNAFGWAGSKGQLRWDIGLTTAIALELVIKGGAGESEFDLRDLHITALHISGGVGVANIILPHGTYTAHIDCGVGKIDVVVPHSTTATLIINGGAGDLSLAIGEQADVTARIAGGVGGVQVRLARDEAARVEAQRGIGGIKVPHVLAAQGESAWQTPGYDDASRRTLIQYRGGVGGFTVTL